MSDYLMHDPEFNPHSYKINRTVTNSKVLTLTLEVHTNVASRKVVWLNLGSTQTQSTVTADSSAGSETVSHLLLLKARRRSGERNSMREEWGGRKELEPILSKRELKPTDTYFLSSELPVCPDSPLVNR